MFEVFFFVQEKITSKLNRGEPGLHAAFTATLKTQSVRNAWRNAQAFASEVLYTHFSCSPFSCCSEWCVSARLVLFRKPNRTQRIVATSVFLSRDRWLLRAFSLVQVRQCSCECRANKLGAKPREDCSAREILSRVEWQPPTDLMNHAQK